MNKYEKAIKVIRCALSSYGASDNIKNQLAILEELVEKQKENNDVLKELREINLINARKSKD